MLRSGYDGLDRRDWGRDGLELIRRGLAGLALIDAMLPGLNGLEVCKRVRAKPAARVSV